MLACVLNQFDNLRYGTLAKGLGGAHLNDTTQVDAARDDVVTFVHLQGHTLARQGHRVQTRFAFNNRAVQGYLLAWAYLDDRAHSHLIRTHRLLLTGQSCHVRTDVHQVRDARPTLSFGQALEILAHLEEQHHKDGLSKLALGAWQETDAEGADGGHRHQEMLVEGVAMRQALGSLLQCACAYY